MKYYYADSSNSAVGPVEESQLDELFKTGVISRDTYVLPEGTETWLSYTKARNPVPPPPSIPPSLPRASQLAAGNAMNTPPIASQTAPQKNQSGCMTTLAIIGGLFVLVIGGCMVFSGILVSSVSDVAKTELAKSTGKLDDLSNATPSNLSPKGELARIFTLGSSHTDVQRENKEAEIKNQIVDWTLPVYEVSRVGNIYMVTTISNEYIVGTKIKIHPRSDSDRQKIESFKENQLIHIRGYISGVFLRHVEIEPAILLP